jgi:hypothetical protein
LVDKPSIVITQETLKKLDARAPKCFLCANIAKDFRENGKLTGYPLDWGGSGTFPVEGKIRHLKLEELI